MNSPKPEIVNGPILQRARGIGRIAAKQDGDRTRLETLFQEGCGKIRLPNTHSHSLEAVLINTAGGITGGDHLQWSAELAPGGHMVLTTQACERSYRSTGDFGRVETALRVGADAHLDWLPQETILFAASKLDRRLEVELDEGATLTAIEAVLLGRDAMGEDAADALLRDNWRIRRNGRLIHAEATQLQATAAERHSASLLAGNRAFATVLHVAATPDRAAAMGTRIRSCLRGEGNIAASVSQSRLVIRAMAPTGLALRRMIVPVLLELTAAGSLPRLWHL
ncbi:urease accessory protein UreD [uncultured Devosia sp.]|uniref:urease accessory protein UreD n=1 Tax=uncultured Devosia sp. TaxID=211434 RepID=UPI002624CA5D|nr:urease accessory protein UreD [uncultured Devosia sp.]